MSANDELQAHTCEKMLQEYGNVANNVAQANSQHLTEQWKKGELNTGWYYLKTEKETSIGLYYEAFGHKIWTLRPMENIEEVLSIVPSYEEWHQLHKFLEEFNALEVAKENQQLKELLWACQDELYSHLDSGAEAMADAITNAIGEKNNGN